MSTVFDAETNKEITRAAAEARANDFELHARLIEAGVTITLIDFLKAETVAGNCPGRVTTAMGEVIGQMIGFWLQAWPTDLRIEIASKMAKALIEAAMNTGGMQQPQRMN